MNNNCIPTINLNDSDENIIAEIDRAFSTIGFLFIEGHPMPRALITRIRQQLIAYFGRSIAEKSAESITQSNYRGYIPLGFFSPNTEGTNPDQYEGYKLHCEVAANNPIRSQCDLYGPNKWPKEPALLRKTILQYWAVCDQISHRLIGLLATIMGVNPDWFLSLFDYPLTNMTLLHYPPQNPERSGYGIHPHKDTDAFTLLFPDKVGGLWIKKRHGGEWIEVNSPGDAMLVNIGDLLELWSGGYFVSTPHKVVNETGAERYSFPFFVVPRHDVVVKPLIKPQPDFARSSVPVGTVSKEVWRTNWSTVESSTSDFDLGTLSD